MKIIQLIFLTFVILGIIECTQFGPFSTQPPNPNYRKYAPNPQEPSAFWGDLKGPYATNSWFENFVVGSGEDTVSTFPILMKALSSGFSFTCSQKSRITAAPQFVIQPFIPEWFLTTIEEIKSHVVTAYDLLSVTYTYSSDSGSIVFPIVIGSPFFTAVYDNLTPNLTTIMAIMTCVDRDGQTYSYGQITQPSTKFTVFLNTGSYWTIYTSAPIQFQVSTGGLLAQASYTGSLRVILTGATGESDKSLLFDQYAGAYPISGNIDYTFDSDNLVTFYYNWVTAGEGELLMLAMPHHQEIIINPLISSISFFSFKGTMVGVAGKQWVLRDNLVTLLWDAPRDVDSDKVESITAALLNDYQWTPEGIDDPYFFGVAISRLARLALIADDLGEKDIAAYIRNTMMEYMTPWLQGTNVNPLEYDTTYGGICSEVGLADPGADFGQGRYNDHHFHYGYHLYALAVIGKENPEYLQENEPQVMDLIRDIANPSSEDPFFTNTRHKDFFNWHSWAAGMYEFGDNRNQESSSEALNAYYGVYLIGEALGRTDIKNYGNLLLIMELRAVRKYYHIPSSSDIYPAVFAQNKMVGVLWCLKVDYITFFGSSPVYIHGIQMLPFTPITELSLDPAFITEEYPVIAAAAASSTYDPTWDPIIVADLAIIDKNGAWTAAQSLTEFAVGNTLTNTLWWIASRPNQAYEKGYFLE